MPNQLILPILNKLLIKGLFNSLVSNDTIWQHRTWVNIGWANGLLLDGTKSLPEPILTSHYLGPLIFTWGLFHWESSSDQSLICCKISHLKLPPYHRVQWVKIKHCSLHIHTSVNLLWPSDDIWCKRTLSTLVQVRACCLTAPSPYLNQC